MRTQSAAAPGRGDNNFHRRLKVKSAVSVDLDDNNPNPALIVDFINLFSLIHRFGLIVIELNVHDRRNRRRVKTF